MENNDQIFQYEDHNDDHDDTFEINVDFIDVIALKIYQDENYKLITYEESIFNTY